MWGQGVIVDNRPGASGNIGSEAVVRSPADGYTLLLQNSTMVVNPAVSGTSNYDPEKDLTPIMLLGVHPDRRVRAPERQRQEPEGDRRRVQGRARRPSATAPAATARRSTS